MKIREGSKFCGTSEDKKSHLVKDTLKACMKYVSEKFFKGWITF